MALELTGKITKILETQEGEGANGSWRRGGFVIEYGDNFPKSVCCTLWGDKLNMLEPYKEGQDIKVSIDLSSREYNGRWYTDVRPWRIEPATAGSSPTSQPGGPTAPPKQGGDSDFNIDDTSTDDGDEEDDLPF